MNACFLRRIIPFFAVGLVCSVSASAARVGTVESPDGRLVVTVDLDDTGAPGYSVNLAGREVLAYSHLGLVRSDADFSRGLVLVGQPSHGTVKDRYEILTAKRRFNAYAAHRLLVHLRDGAGRRLDIDFQVSNDGFAYRYAFPEIDPTLRQLTAERSSFHFPDGTRAWLQPLAVAKTGWSRTNPSYEEYYRRDIPTGTPSSFGAGWAYPALFRVGETWVLLSEGTVPRNYCGTRLSHLSPDSEYTVAYPDPREGIPGMAVAPESTLPWSTPWRIGVVGSLATVTESMLGVDLAEHSARPLLREAPGKASWSWPLLGDGATTFDVQKRFIDYAVQMGWRYTLLDALWDKQIGDARLRELVDYARSHGVAILVWENSNGNWNDAPQTPLGKLTTHEDRAREFARLRSLGIAGVKVDFFGGDGQSMMAYQRDILDDAAEAGLLVNFHGTTLPRGLQRAYPNLMTAEAIRGLEFITFDQAAADEEPSHAAMLPFTRNIFDPMDFTPMVLDRINSRVVRRTTSAFELALSVLFTSGIQHYGEIPEGMEKAPTYVREFVRGVPSVWEDVRLLAGEPGRYVVVARKAAGVWHVAGINADSKPREVALDLAQLGVFGEVALITDGGADSLGFRTQRMRIEAAKPMELSIAPHGGFVFKSVAALPAH